MKKPILMLFIAGIIACFLYMGTQPVAALAWGDSDGGRQTYSLQEISEGALGDKITFNSIVIADSDYEWHERVNGSEIGKGTIKNELVFVGAREDTGINAGVDNVWNGSEIAVEDGKTYLVRLYVHNNSLYGMDSVAEDTRVWFNIPSGSDEEIRVNGYISSSNASPSEYIDYVDFTSDVPFHLEYQYGSALLENGGIGKGGGIQLSDNIVNARSAVAGLSDGGVLIGYDALDGRVPGCYQYANYVTIKVKVVYDYEFSVETKVRLADSEDNTWQDSIEAKVGDKVEFQVQYENISDYMQEGVAIKDVLPSNLRYVEGTAKLYNVLYPNGLTFDEGTVVTTGVRIGDYTIGSNAFIRITAEVVDDNLARGSNTLYNWGQAGVGSTVIQDYATVIVYNDKVFKIIILELTILIFICLVFIGILLAKKRRLEHSSVRPMGRKDKK